MLDNRAREMDLVALSQARSILHWDRCTVPEPQSVGQEDAKAVGALVWDIVKFRPTQPTSGKSQRPSLLVYQATSANQSTGNSAIGARHRAVPRDGAKERGDFNNELVVVPMQLFKSRTWSSE